MLGYLDPRTLGRRLPSPCTLADVPEGIGMTVDASGDEIRSPELARLLVELTVERYRPVPARPFVPPRAAQAAVFGELHDVLPDQRRDDHG